MLAGCTLLSRPSGWVASPCEGLDTDAHSFPTCVLGEKRKGTLPRSLPPSPQPGWDLPPSRVAALHPFSMDPNQPGLVSVPHPCFLSISPWPRSAPTPGQPPTETQATFGVLWTLL